MTAIRYPAVAGTFYPAERDVLERQLGLLMSEAANDAPVTALPKAIIGPHAGYIYSGPVAARAYARLTGARGKISRVVLIGPSHYLAFRGLAIDTADAWAMPSGMVPLDKDAIARVRGLPMVGELDAAFQREHALEVHVPFLQQLLGEFRLVPIVAGDAPPDAVAAVFDALWGGPETLIVISTDLSHYLDYAACRRVDQATAEAIERFDLDAVGPSQACGAIPTRGLLLEARRRRMTIERLDLRNSGDTAGPKDRVVGYGAWALYEDTYEDTQRARIEEVGSELIGLARRSVLTGLATGEPPPVTIDGAVSPLLAAPGAAFVTLRRHDGALRGCIGSAVATRPLMVDVAQHAFNAAFRDPRFPALEWLELPGLSLSVSVLTPPEPMRFADEADLLQQLRPGSDGLIIEDLGQRALFLPSVWEEVPEPRQFLSLLKLKAGLGDQQFSATFRALRFRSIEVKGTMAEGNGAIHDRLGWRVIG
ncbi:MAG TPA: AmmeMemoRadiSam system protein B [Acetobacteraceae bacterium]|nr:AmmeMemoRadiSam system protein B [Acetobacteraceae bacterium]